MTLKLEPKIVLLGGRIAEISRDFAKKIGYEAERLVGEDVTTIVPESFRPFAEESLKRGGKIVIVGGDGRLHELEAVFDDDRTLLVDFSELKDVIRRTYSAVWQFHYGFMFLDEYGNVITCNDTFYDFTGLKAGDVEGKKVWEVFGDRSREVVEKALSGEESVDIVIDYGGGVFRGRAKFRIFDVYGRKIIEVLLRTVEDERVRNLDKTFGELNYPVIVVDGGKVVYQNKKALEVFGDRVGREWNFESGDVQHVKIKTSKGIRDFIVFRMEAEERIYLFFDFSEYARIVEDMERELLSYREMVEKSIDTILIIDNYANILFVNQAVKAYGYKPEEVVGRKFTDYLPPEEAKSILEEYKNFLKTGDFRRREVQVYTKDGKVRWVDVLGRGIRGKDGKIEQSVVIIRDVTERKRMMEELWKSRELYRSFFELSPDFVGVVDMNGRILYVNRQFLDEVGKSIDEIKGTNILDFVYAEDKRKGIEVFRKALKSRETVRETLRTVINGEIRTLDVAVKFIYDGDEPLHALIVSRDISERIELEKRLREREELYRTLTENSLAAIFVVQDDRIVYCNKVFEVLTGYSREEWEKMDAYACFDDDVAEKAREVVRKALNGKIVATTARYRTKSGEKRYADFIMAPIEYKGKKAVIGNAVDITERKRAEIKLIEREELYRTLTESSHTGIFIINKDEKIVYANPKLFEMFGYSRKEIREFKHPYDVIAPEFKEMTIDRLRRRLRGEDVPESYEIKVRTKRGERWLRVLASRINYRNEPAVLVNVADITDLKMTEEKLRKLNLLLSVVNEINRIVSFEKSDRRLLRRVREALEKLDVKVLILLNVNGGLQIFDRSANIDDVTEVVKLAESYCYTCDNVSIVQMSKNGGWVVISPLSVEGRTYGAIVLITDEPLERDAVEMMETLARDIAFALKAIEMERDREVAIRVILSNLDQFEELADKLRNPLAIIKGYIEVRDEFEHEELIKKISEQANRIERILDELRVREFITYDMKKLLERSGRRD